MTWGRVTCWVPCIGDIQPGGRVNVSGIGKWSGTYYVEKAEPKRGGIELTLSLRKPRTVTHTFGREAG